jgi:hypothetical protein
MKIKVFNLIILDKGGKNICPILVEIVQLISKDELPTNTLG